MMLLSSNWKDVDIQVYLYITRRSILGPIQSLIYVNDINCKFIKTNSLSSRMMPNVTKDKFCIRSIYPARWSFSLRWSKGNMELKQKQLYNLAIVIVIVIMTDKEKYLGIIILQKLPWNDHILSKGNTRQTKFWA